MHLPLAVAVDDLAIAVPLPTGRKRVLLASPRRVLLAAVQKTIRRVVLEVVARDQLGRLQARLRSLPNPTSYVWHLEMLKQLVLLLFHRLEHTQRMMGDQKIGYQEKKEEIVKANLLRTDLPVATSPRKRPKEESLTCNLHQELILLRMMRQTFVQHEREGVIIIAQAPPFRMLTRSRKS